MTRFGGRSSVAAAAYRAGEELVEAKLATLEEAGFTETLEMVEAAIDGILDHLS